MHAVDLQAMTAPEMRSSELSVGIARKLGVMHNIQVVQLRSVHGTVILTKILFGIFPSSPNLYFIFPKYTQMELVLS